MDATKLPPPAAAAPAPEPEAAKTMMDGGQSIAGRFLVMGAGSATPTGRMHEARDTQHGGALVSLKLVDAKVLPNPSMSDRALRELKQLGKVSSERIAHVIDQGKTSDGLVYVATEVVGGKTLEELVRSEGALSMERATAIVLQIGEALTEAQKVGVIHRDVAPRNVHVLAGDKVKVTEFGLAEAVNEKVFGAPAYLSPEQVEARPVDQRSNIYSLGAIFYFALTGHPPFEGDAAALLQQQLNATPQPPSAKKPGLSAEVDRVILKALEKSGGRRHLTLRQLLSEIEALAHAKPAAPDAGSARTMMAEAPAVTARPAPDMHNAKTMMGIPSPLGGATGAMTTPTMPTAAPTNPSLPAQQAAPTPVAPDVNARTMMAEAPVVPPMSNAATMMASAPNQPPATTVEKKPVNASPQVQAAVAAAQAQVAAQKAQAAAAPAPAGPTAKGGFRETAWFKAGEIQEEMEKAKAAADAQAGGDALAPTGTTGQHASVVDGEVDLNKVNVDATDKARLSLKTGATQMMKAVQAPTAAVPGERMDENEMLAEIDNSKKKLLIAGAIVAVVVIVVVLFLTMGGKQATPGKTENTAPPPTAVATAPPAPTPATAPAPVATPPPAAVKNPPPPAPTPAAPTESNPSQLLSEAKAAIAKDNLALGTDLLTKALGAGANVKQLKKLEAQLAGKVDKKLKAAKKAKDRAGEEEAKALKERLVSLKLAKRK